MKLNFETDISDLLIDYAVGVEEGIKNGLEEVAKFAQSHAENTSLFNHNGSNGLKKNIIIKEAGSNVRDVIANKPYASYVEYGRPGFSAKNAKALRFVINGEVIFRKSVGPAPPKPFMKQAAEAAQQKADFLMNQEIEQKMR